MERLSKFLVCIVIAPLLSALMVGLAVLMLFLPILALIVPDVIKFKR